MDSILRQMKLLDSEGQRCMQIPHTLLDKHSKDLMDLGISVQLKSRPGVVDETDIKYNPEHYDSGCPENDWYFQLEWDRYFFTPPKETPSVEGSELETDLIQYRKNIVMCIKNAKKFNDRRAIIVPPRFPTTLETVREELLAKGYDTKILEDNCLLVILRNDPKVKTI